MKKTITESQLRNIIAESVKSIISELDWKTYMNAGKKRLQQTNSDKYANGFDSLMQAEREFNKNYGANTEKNGNKRSFWGDELERYGGTSTYGDVEGQYGNPKDIRLQVKNDLSRPSLNRVGKYATLTYDPKYKNAGADDIWTNNHDPEYHEKRHFSHRDHDNPILGAIAKSEYETAKREADAYENGDYEYVKGKGWQLKDNMDESIRRAIRKVLH